MYPKLKLCFQNGYLKKNNDIYIFHIYVKKLWRSLSILNSWRFMQQRKSKNIDKIEQRSWSLSIKGVYLPYKSLFLHLVFSKVSPVYPWMVFWPGCTLKWFVRKIYPCGVLSDQLLSPCKTSCFESVIIITIINQYSKSFLCNNKPLL